MGLIDNGQGLLVQIRVNDVVGFNVAGLVVFGESDIIELHIAEVDYGGQDAEDGALLLLLREAHLAEGLLHLVEQEVVVDADDVCAVGLRQVPVQREAILVKEELR